MQANSPRDSNETGVLTRSMRNILSDDRCETVFSVLREAGVHRANALKYVYCFWVIFEDVPFNSPMDDAFSNDSYENRHLNAVAESRWLHLIDDIEECGGVAYEEATSLVDLIIDRFESEFVSGENEDAWDQQTCETTDLDSDDNSDHESG